MTTAPDALNLTLPEALSRRLERALRPLDDRNCTVAFAESCTAGLAASAVSGIDGLGHVLDCAFVTYSDGAKTRLLGVDADLIKRRGAVSEPVALAMAEGALKRSAADVAISVTGYAGPAGPGDEEGLVHFALARTGREPLHRVEHFGPRGQAVVRLEALGVIVDLLEIAGEPRAAA